MPAAEMVQNGSTESLKGAQCPLTLDTINAKVREAQYAVRCVGLISFLKENGACSAAVACDD
jgi:hypothetical protein